MKLRFISCLVLILFLSLCSCKHNQSNIVLINESDSLKSTILDKENSTNWTQELAPERLIYPIDRFDNMSLNVKLENNLFLQDKKLKSPVYPYIEDFASLDTTFLTLDLKNLIKSFSQSFCNGFSEFSEDIINQKYFFNYIFFRYDLENKWPEYFGQKYPEMPKATEEKPNPSVKLFKSYIIGEPFISTELVQVPLRFYGKQGSLDIQLNITYNESNYKINQIDIIGWEKSNE